MTRPTGARGVRSTLRRSAAAVTSVALGAVACGFAALASPAAARSDDPTTPVEPGGVTMVQANIYTGLTVDKFQADVRTVLAQQPDFITYNEVMFRKDPVLAPAGYAIYRSMKNRFTAETPVAWRTDRWTAINHGTTMISDHRGKPPGREVEIGRRNANWVTLQGVDGRVVSVVTVHTAPVDPHMPDLIRPSVTRLGALVDKLAPAGPVLVGGDFNVHYTSHRYPRDILAAHSLVPTYDELGSYFPTGDHEGATIDYLFKRDDHGDLAASSQRPVELNSDHDAVVATYSWLTDAPSATSVVTSQPNGQRSSQRAALASVLSGLRSTPAGGVAELATRHLDLATVVRGVRLALDRGAHVRLVVSGTPLTQREVRVQRMIAGRGDADSWFRQCDATCRSAWTGAHLPTSLLLVSDATGAPTARYDVNRALVPALVERTSSVRVSRGPVALQDAADKLATLG
jgi:hypothetical protein